MNETELAEIVAELRAVGRDNAEIEAKRSASKLPSSVRESLSAFANTRGGVVVLGLDESDGFRATGVSDPGKISSDLAALSRDEMDPPLSPLITTALFEGVVLVVAEVPELPRDRKPCYYRGGGLTNGCFVRVGDSDRRLTHYEVQLMLSNRGQPRRDEEPVPGTSLDDLDSGLVRTLVDRLRAARPHAYGALTDPEVLRRNKILVPHGEGEVLSLAGLLALGLLPQEFFPQLMLSFVYYPTPGGADTATGLRYLDSVVAEGAIPLMVQIAMNALRRNMKRRAVVSGAGRQDIWEYPEIALREAIVNALVHRDLAPESRGTQVQVEMYPDRLIIRNPGGLFGPITVDSLGEGVASSARNATLMRILRDVVIPEDNRPVCENIGSGIREMIRSLRAASMHPPTFHDKIATFAVVFPNHSLLSADVVAWIHSLNERGLTDSQCLGLAMMRDGEFLDNRTYRNATGVDSRVATLELQDLVRRGLVAQEGIKRWASYGLLPTALSPTQPRQRADRRRDILAALGDAELSRAEIGDHTGLGDAAVRRWLRIMQEQNLIERIGPARSPNVRYRRRKQLFDDPVFDELIEDASRDGEGTGAGGTA